MIHQISLDVPADLKSMIREQVLINVTVDIDQSGKVTAAEVASTKGEEAALLTTEALKAARWFRFRPSRRGNKAVLSQTVLTFVFDPDSVVSEDLPPRN
jgi:TonB family protein